MNLNYDHKNKVVDQKPLNTTRAPGGKFRPLKRGEGEVNLKSTD